MLFIIIIIFFYRFPFLRSSGLSTRALRAAFPGAQVTGLDASPYMLAVASYREKAVAAAAASGAGPAPAGPPLRLIHGLAEDSGLASGSQDLVR